MRWLAVILASALPLSAIGENLPNVSPYASDPLSERERASQAPRLFWEDAQRLDHSSNGRVRLDTGEIATFELGAQGHLRLQLDDDQSPPLLWLSRDGELWWQASWTPSSEGDEWLHVQDKPSPLRAQLEAETDFRGQLFVAALDPVDAPDTYQETHARPVFEPDQLIDDDGERRDVQRLEQGEVTELEVEGPVVLAVSSRPAEAAKQQQYALSWRLNEGAWRQISIERTQLSSLYQEAGTVRFHGGMDRHYITIPEGRHRLNLKASLALFARVEQAEADYFLDFNEPEPTTAELTQGLLEYPLRANNKTLEEVDALRQSNHLDGAADIALGFLERHHLDQASSPFPGAQQQSASQTLAGEIERNQRFFRTLFPDASARPEGAPLTMHTAWFATTSPLDIEADEDYYLGEEVLERLSQGLFVELNKEPLRYSLPKRAGPSRLRLAVARLLHHEADFWVQFDDAPAQRLRLSALAKGVMLPTPEDAVLSHRKAAGKALVHPTLGGDFTASREPGHYWPAASAELPLPADVDEVRVWSGQPLSVALQYRASQPFEAGESAYRALLEQAPDVGVAHLHRVFEAVMNPAPSPLTLDPTPEEALENQWYPMLRYLHAAQTAYLDDQKPEVSKTTVSHLDERLTKASKEAQRENWVSVLEILGQAGYGHHPVAYQLSQQALEQLGEHYLARRQRLATAIFGRDIAAKRLATDETLRDYANTQSWGSQVRLLAARYLREGDKTLLDPLGEALHRAGDSLWATQLGLLLNHEGATPEWLPEAAEEAGWHASANGVEQSAAKQALRQGDLAAREGNDAQAMDHWQNAGEEGRKRRERMRTAKGIARQLKKPNHDQRLAGIERWLDWSLSSEQAFDWVSLNSRIERAQGFATLFSEVTQRPLTLPRTSKDAPLEVEVVGPTVLRVQLRRVAPDARETEELDWLSAELVDDAGKTMTLKSPILSRAENPYLQSIHQGMATATSEDKLMVLPPGLHRVRISPQRHAYLTQLWQWQPVNPWAVLPPVTPLGLKDLLQASSSRDDFLTSPLPKYFQVLDGELEPLTVMPAAQLYSRELVQANTVSLQDSLEALEFPTQVDVVARTTGPEKWPQGSQLVQVDNIAVGSGVPVLPEHAYAVAVALIWQLEQTPENREMVSARLAQLAEVHSKVPAIRQLADSMLQGYRWERISSSFESAGVRQLPLQEPMHSPFRRVRQALLSDIAANAMFLSGRGIEGVELYTPEPLTVRLHLAQRVLPHEARVPAEVMIQVDEREPRRIRLLQREITEQIHLQPGEHALRLRLKEPRQQQYVTARLTRDESGTPLLEEETRTYHIAAPDQPASFYIKGPAWVRVNEWSLYSDATSYRFVAPGWQTLTFEAGSKEDRYYRLHVLRQSPSVDVPLEPSMVKANLAVPVRGPAPPPEPTAPLAWSVEDHYLPGAGLDSWGGYLGFVERIDGSEDDVEPIQGTTALEAGVSYRFRQPDRRLFSRSDLLLRQLEGSQEVVGAKQWIDFYPDNSDWQLGFFGEAYLQPGRVDDVDGSNHWSARLQGSAERTYRLTPRLRHEPAITLNQRWLSLDSETLINLGDIDPDIFSPYKDDHRRSLILSDRLTWSPHLDQRIYLEGALVSNESLNPFDPDYGEVSTSARQLFGSVSGELGLRWRRYFNDGDRSSSTDQKRVFLGADLLRFDSGTNAWTLSAQGDYDVERSDFGFRLDLGFESNEGRLSPAKRPDEMAFVPLRRAQQRGRVKTNRLTPQGPQEMDVPALQNGGDIAVTHAVDRYIQVMALSTQAAALELQQTLDQKLDMPTRLVSGGGFHRVQVGTHAHGVASLRQHLNALGYVDTFMVKQD
ncbi:hypothetical protein QC823_14230 [Halomonas vilamensis]|uniref:SPOR domain-containing protein n=1 Tax=Vreelandella vilamensis TaxID=531309 RepID=A0ABU1H759_9GAMM|nr:hypothetical protein [Halomonas vilamensis]MDR5900138.1 hypothetical protein [Halomonas vilamensis]